MRALVSVYDKTGLCELALGLTELGWELVASGNTARELAAAGIDHIEVATLTGAPEMLGGRVKTLHPTVHGGILADRSVPEHLHDLETQGIEPIDLVVCNLYPFASDPSIELIDVGGPTMLRAAAKNHAHVGVVVDPADYPGVLAELRARGELSDDTRRRLARAAFAHSAAYDAAITAWFDAGGAGGTPQALPDTLHLTLERSGALRYGENPHQSGARYRARGTASWWDAVRQHAGAELSYLNVFDADAAWRLVHELAPGQPGVPAAAVIVKHANPCGAALGEDLGEAYRAALEGDPLSAFGGIVALAGCCTEAVARVVAEGPQADVIIATAWDDEAIAVLSARRRTTRLLEAPVLAPSDTSDTQGTAAAGGEAPPVGIGALDVRRLSGGFLVQETDRLSTARHDWQVVTKAVPTSGQWSDLELAWRVCARTSSNAVVVAGDRRVAGVGAGQQSRVDAAQIAVRKAGSRARGAAAASDAFFPFRDGLDVLADAGVTAVVQPGGSLRDPEVVAAADEHEIAMVFTGERHFRH